MLVNRTPSLYLFIVSLLFAEDSRGMSNKNNLKTEEHSSEHQLKL